VHATDLRNLDLSLSTSKEKTPMSRRTKFVVLVGGAAIVAALLPRLVQAALLRFTGTVVRDEVH
jgi:hypothetical protein